MLRLIDHDGVRELEMSSWASRRSGYKVSAFLHRGILIDTGFPRARRELAMWLDRQPINGAIVTHWHEDHAGNLPLLVERDIPVSMPAATLARIRAPAPVRAEQDTVSEPPLSVAPLRNTRDSCLSAKLAPVVGNAKLNPLRLHLTITG